MNDIVFSFHTVVLKYSHFQIRFIYCVIMVWINILFTLALSCIKGKEILLLSLTYDSIRKLDKRETIFIYKNRFL